MACLRAITPQFSRSPLSGKSLTVDRRNLMGTSLTCALKPHRGEVWQLDDGDDGLVLLAGKKVVTVIPHGLASLRVHLPSFFGSRYITVDLGGGNLVCFEPKAKDISRVRQLVEASLNRNPRAAAAALDRKANRDLLIGGGSMLLGLVITVWSFIAAGPGGTFVVTTGLLVVGLIEVIRGIYFKSKAGERKQFVRKGAKKGAKKRHPT
jgi:hypothetical protein